MSRSCQSATFSSAAISVARAAAAPGPTTCSQPIGLRLCGIADEPFWPLPNGSSTSPISVFCRPRISSANFSSDAAVMASAREQLRVPVALDDLRRDRRRLAGRAARTRRASIDGSQVGEGADGARDLADADGRRGRGARARCRARSPRTRARASGRRSSARRARRASGRSSASAGAPRRASRTASASAVEVRQDQVARLAHLERLRGVDDVRRGEAEVQPARRRPDLLGHRRRERDDVVLRRLLDLLDAGDVERALLADVARRLGRDDARRRPSPRPPPISTCSQVS